MPFIIETPQVLAFWTCLAKFGWRFGISGWAFLLAKPPSQLLSLLQVDWKLPAAPALAERSRYALWLTKWVWALFTMRAVRWVSVSPPLCLNSQVHCRWNSLRNDTGTSGHILSTELEGYFGCYGQSRPSVLCSDIFEFMRNWSWDKPSNKNCPFYRCPIPVQSLIFPKILWRHKKVSLYCSQATPTEMWLRR